MLPGIKNAYTSWAYLYNIFVMSKMNIITLDDLTTLQPCQIPR